jgi:flagellin
MAFTVQTNVSSLHAQEYLRASQDFQSRTISRVTSGLRIVSSGDDAAGLAIANTFRSDRAVITQGIRNANDGLSSLQTIDGGLNNISQLLDRARTLAAQSATGTFTGDRTLLNGEFSSVIDEIDRQSKSIGLDTGGSFAATLKAFIGGGRGSTNAQVISNGTVQVDLSQSIVDARGLKLKGFQAEGAAAADVDEIVGNSTNTGSVVVAGKTDLFFRGSGFSDDDRIRVAVNLAGVDTADELVTAINNAITDAGNAGTSAATQFKNTGIRAKILTKADNSQALVFESANGAFQVSAGDRLANALLGNHTNNVGTELDYIVNGAASTASTGTTFSAARDIIVRVQGGTLASPTDLTLSVTTSTTVQSALTSLSSLVANNSSLIAAGISLTTASAGSALSFTSKRGENFEVLSVNDIGNRLGLGTASNTTGTTVSGFDVTSITSQTFTAATGAATFAISVGGGGYVTLSHSFTTSTTSATLVDAFNTQFSQNTALQQAGLVAATAAGGAFSISSNNGTYFRVSSNTTSGSVDFGFGALAGVTTTTSVATTSNTTSATLVSGGASSSSLLAFSAIRNGNDDQAITLTARDAAGVEQSVAITLAADSSAQRARTIDEAISYINAQIQAHSSADVRKIVAVKERDEAASGAEKIRFLSSLASFKVAVGDNPNDTGVTTSQGTVVDSSLLTGGSNIDISTAANAETAVNALAEAVAHLGRVQAAVGRGQNQFNFAVSLAHTQLTNIAASESRIRDADLAAEAANLTKAQILQQAGIAALAQANASPQAILSLLRG